MDDMLYDALEKMNEEKQNILGSKKYKIGKIICEIKDTLFKFKFKSFLNIIKGRRIKRKTMKKYYHPDAHDIVENKSINYKKAKIAIYTCIVGNYDNLQIPLIQFENVDFYIFTDDVDKYKKYSSFYKIKKIDKNILKLGNIYANRFIKFHPSSILKNYDYAIYLDGNIRVISDIRTFVNKCNKKTGIAMHIHRERNDIYEEAIVCDLLKRGNKKMMNNQIIRYKNEGFPEKYGMNEATVIVSDLNNKVSIDLLSQWYDEFVNSKSLRDQIAWPYVLWKNNYRITDVGNLGNNIYKNYKIEIVRHL